MENANFAQLEAARDWVQRLVERAGGKDGEVLVWVIWWEREGAVASRVRFEYGADAMHCMIVHDKHALVYLSYLTVTLDSVSLHPPDPGKSK